MTPPVAGYVAWFDFGDPAVLFTDTGRTTPVSADGQTIKGVADKGSFGAHLSEASTPPTYKVGIYNGLSTSRWDGSIAKTLTSGAVTIAQPITRIVVARSLNTDAALHVTIGTAVSGEAAGPNYNVSQWNIFAGTNVNQGTADKELHVFTMVLNSTASFLYVDGTAVMSGVNPGTATFAAYELGSYAIGSFVWAGDICEMIDYASALSTDNRLASEAYARNRWLAVQVPPKASLPFIPQGRAM